MNDTERLELEFARNQVEDLERLLQFAKTQITEANKEIEYLRETLKAQSSINQLYLGMLEAKLDADC